MDYTTFLFSNPPKDRKSTILVDADQSCRSITWEDYASSVKRVAVGLRDLGVVDGQCIALWSRNDIYYPILGDGTVAAGAIFTGLPPFATKSEVMNLLRAAEASWIFAEPHLLEDALLVAQEIGVPAAHVLAFDPPGLPQYHGPQGTFNQLLQNDESSWKSCESHDGQKTCFRLLTSGTTGLPKAANISHAAQIARTQCPLPTWKGPPSEVKWLHVVGMYHLSGLFTSNSAVLGEHIAHITTSLAAKDIIENIRKHGITCTLLPPRVMEEVTATLIAGDIPRDSLKSLKAVSVIGSPARQNALCEFNSFLSSEAVLQSPYGSTETGTMTILPPNMPFVPGFVGVAAPGVEIQIINHQTLKPVEPDTRGEVCVRGPALFNGYLHNPSATKSAFLSDSTGNSYRTGDQGYFNSTHQQYSITGRYKEIFKVRYEEVSPSEVESVLLQHPGIHDAAVTSAPARDNEMDCECVAYIVAEGEMKAGDVVGWVAERMSRHKVPVGVFFSKEIPRNRMGRIQRHALGGIAVQDRSVRYFEGAKTSE